jgi:hypothetical protein
MQFREPGQIDPTYIDTDHEQPALPKESSWPGAYENPCPYWHAPVPHQSKLIDLGDMNLEKLAARAMWTCMGAFTLVITSICLWKVVLMVAALK